MSEGTRLCPFCQETIRAEAIKCRWCGEVLPAAGKGGIEVVREESAPSPTPDEAIPVVPVHHPEPAEAIHPEGATTILVLGILSLVFLGVCIGFILGIIAWVMGNSYLDRCRALRVEPEGSAVAGRICGIIAVVIGIVFIALAIMMGGCMPLAARGMRVR